MKIEKLMYAMNDIKDDYIIEYAGKTKETKPAHSFKTWPVVAACLVLAIICTPALIHFFTPSEIDDPKAGVQHDFSSYDELREVIPDNSIIANIPNSENADIDSYGICPKGTTDFTDYCSYSYLSIDISYDDGTGVSIFCTIESEKTTKEYVQSKPLSFPADDTTKITIAHTEFYYTHHPDSGFYVSVFSVDGDLFELRTSSLNEEELIQYVSDILNN